MTDNYKQLVERLSQSTKLSVEDIERRIEAKRAKLSGLISLEGAAHVIAAELGIGLEKQNYKISELNLGMRKVIVLGKIIQIYPVKTYKKNEREGEIGSFMIADETGNIRVVLWDTNHIKKIKDNEIKEGDVVEIMNADVRGTLNKELHLNSFSKLEKSSAEITDIIINKPQRNENISKISELKQDSFSNLRGTIVQVFQPAFFNVCPTCNMKVSFDNEKAICPRHELVTPKERAILNMVIDDGTETIRAIAFTDQINEIYGMIEDIELLKDPGFNNSKRAEVLGKEFIFSGKTRHNALFDRTEFIINRAREANPDEVIVELSKTIKLPA